MTSFLYEHGSFRFHVSESECIQVGCPRVFLKCVLMFLGFEPGLSGDAVFELWEVTPAVVQYQAVLVCFLVVASSYSCLFFGENGNKLNIYDLVELMR